MAEDNNKKPNIFSKVMEAGEAYLENIIQKSRENIKEIDKSEIEDSYYRKSIYSDKTYGTGSQGYQDKNYRISYELLKQMSLKDSIVSAIIQTRVNQVSAFSKPVKNQFDRGFRIALKDEESALNKIKEELFGLPEDSKEKNIDSELSADEADKAEANYAAADTDNDMELSEREMDRQAYKVLQEQTAEKIKEITDFISNCGLTDDRPFESKKWDLTSFLRAITRDSLVYDQLAMERVPEKSGKLHHFLPVDGKTVRYATPELSSYKNFQTNAGYDILYPEKELEYLKEETDALELDSEKLDDDAYKFVQVVRGRIVRAFTEKELALGMRNPTTDIYSNGYSVAELELLTNLVTAHLNAENFNISYHTQGFSAKGILHIKANINRRKLETVRQQWNHMLKGSRNFFQTPIFAGMDDVQWIPLNQDHTDMEFQNWTNYLVKLICGIYQIDPAEIGYGLKDEGGAGGSLSGDNTAEKLLQSKDKGFRPLMRFIEEFINKEIIDFLDEDYKFEFIGIDGDSKESVIARQEKEVKFKRTVNEIREEEGLRPIPGADDLILDPNYFQWFSAFHPEGKKLREEGMLNNEMGSLSGYNPNGDVNNISEELESVNPQESIDETANTLADSEFDLEDTEKSEKTQEDLYKGIKIEYYQIKDEE